MRKTNRQPALLVLSLIFISALNVPAFSDGKVESKKLTVDQRDHNVTAYYGGKKVFSYVYDKSQFKPYVSEFYTPGGLNVLLDSPEDHKHHHGLMYAVGVDGINFWEEVEGSGRQEPQSTSSVFSRSDSGTAEMGFKSLIRWINPQNGAPLVIENRRIQLDLPVDQKSRILTWTSRLSLPEGKKSAELWGAHYFGLGLRFIRSMDENGEFFTAGNKKGEIFRGEERLIPDIWCAYKATADGGRKVTVAMFRDPGNPGENTVWFAMKTPFAYLSATKALHENKQVLHAGETMSLRYAVVLWDGWLDAGEINQLYQVWSGQL